MWIYRRERLWSYNDVGETSDIDRLLDEVGRAIDNIKNTAFEEELFFQIKKKKMGQFIRNFNYIEGMGYMFVSLFVKDVEIFDYMEVLESISYNDIHNQLPNIFHENSRTISIIEPI